MDLYRVAHNLNPENSAPKINTPTLGIVGMQDKMLSPNSQRNLISSIPKARIIKYNDGGHCVLETHAKKVARSIEEFANN